MQVSIELAFQYDSTKNWEKVEGFPHRELWTSAQRSTNSVTANGKLLTS